MKSAEARVTYVDSSVILGRTCKGQFQNFDKVLTAFKDAGVLVRLKMRLVNPKI